MTTALSGKIPYPSLHSGLLSPAFAAIIFGIALRPRWTKFLEWPGLVLLGDASYSLYLLHFTVIWAALVEFGRSAASPVAILAIIVVALAISIASYKFIEQPARKKLRELNLRQLSTAAAKA
jgi:peptidoglycan/LPS O-acetylase OafA/YrhL